MQISLVALTAPGLDSLGRTQLLQEAIDSVHRDGGGILRIPRGRHTIVTLHLRGGVELHLEQGAILEPEPNLDLYPLLPTGHNKDRTPYHLLHASNADDIALSGPGTIDGRGQLFWEAEPPQDAQYRGIFFKAKARRISPLIDFKECRRVRIEGVTLLNSPGWTLNLFNCDSVLVDKVRVDNHLFGPNTDGFDINGCRRVMISNCELRGCDDNIIIKATADARSCEYITVTNCLLESNCAALGIGAETRSDIRFVSISNCSIINAIRMIQIIQWDGGTVEHVVINNISGRAMTPVGTDRVIHLDIQQHLGENPQLGRMRHITISNLTAQTRGRILLTAQDGAMLEDIVLRDIQLDYPEVEDPEVTIPASRSSQLSNFNPRARVARAAVVAENIHGLVLENIRTTWPAESAVPMFGLWANRVDGWVRSPGLQSSHPDLPRILATGSQLPGAD